MGVAEQRDASGLQRSGEVGVARYSSGALTRETVHQVDIQAEDSGFYEHVDAMADDVERLNPADRVLHVGGEVLHPKAESRYLLRSLRNRVRS